MTTYQVKYCIRFMVSDPSMDTIEVEGEMSVLEGTEYAYENDDEEFVDKAVTSYETAKEYIETLYDDDEGNLVDLPEDFQDTELEFLD